MNTPLVSVIVPNYNHARFLDERMESILGQTFQNFEVIILDDVSTDNSREVIEKYRNDPHVSQIVYNEQNSGSPFKQWNKGFSLAKGKLVWITESDDSCDHTILERLVHCFEQHHDLCYAFARSISMDEQGNLGHVIQSMFPNDLYMDGLSFNRQYLKWGNRVFNASGVLFNREAAMSVDHAYMQYRGVGDWLFWMEMAEKGGVAVVSDPLNHYRMYGSNTTRKASLSGKEDIEAYYVTQMFKKHGYFSLKEWLLQKKKFVWTIRYANDYDSEDIRKQLLKLWNPSPLINFLAWISHIRHRS